MWQILLKLCAEVTFKNAEIDAHCRLVATDIAPVMLATAHDVIQLLKCWQVMRR